MSNQQSTVREQQLTIPAKSTRSVDVQQTMPNHFNINNLTATDIYLGVAMVPNTAKYDLYVGPSQSDVTGREQGVSEIRIYNDSATDATIILTTFVKDFDPLILKPAGAGSTAGGGGGSYDGIIRGFNAPLPAGANNIGKVVVTDMPPVTVQQGPLQESTANIGKVKVTELPPLPAGTAKIGDVGIVGAATVIVQSMPPVSLDGNVNLSDNATFAIKGAAQYYGYNASVGTTEVTVTFGYELTNFKYISNDDTANDLLLAFNGALTTGSENGVNGVVRLKPGETLQELNVKATSVKFKRAAGSGNVRFLGV